MPPLTRVVSELHRLAQPADSDAELLDRFVRRHDQTAFTALVERHGPMVLRLCRRVLGDAHAAEDALQATFLVLARRAATLPRPAGLATWLYAVAQRVALRARRAECRARHRTIEEEPCGTASDPLSALTARELLVVLEEELQHLPEPHRMAVVLCCLEGHSRDEAAALLGCTAGALRGWLERGRARLHDLLLKRGITLTAALATAEAARAGADAALVAGAVRAALGTASATVAGLAAGGTMARLPIVLVLALVLGGGVLWLGPATEPASDEPQPAPAPQVQPAHEDDDSDPLPPDAITRIGSTRFRPGDPIGRVLYADNGKTIVCAAGTSIQFWDASTGKRRLAAQVKVGCGAMALAADGKTLHALDDEGYIALDATSGKERYRRRFPAGADRTFHALRVLGPSGAVAVSGPSRKQIHVRDGTPGGDWRSWKLPDDTRDLALTPDGKTLAVAVRGTIHLLNSANGESRAELKTPFEQIGHIAFSPDATIVLASAPFKGTQPHCVLVWDLKTGKHRFLANSMPGYVSAFTADCRYVTFSNNQIPWLPLYEVATGCEIRRFRTWPPCMGLAFSPDGKTLLIGTCYGALTQWDVATGARRPASADPFGFFHPIRFVTGGQHLLVLGDRNAVYDWKTRRELERYAETEFSAALAPDGSLLASVMDKRRSVGLLDPKTGKLIRMLKGFEQTVNTIGFSPDGKKLFSSEWPKGVRIWDVATGRQLHALTDQPVEARSVVWSPDGRQLATACHPQVRGTDSLIRIWDVATGRLIRRIATPWQQVWAIAFAPTGTVLAASGTIDEKRGEPSDTRFFDVETGVEIKALVGEQGPVYALGYSPDGRTLVTPSRSVLRFWETATGQERHRIDGHRNEVVSAVFAPDSAVLAAGSQDALFVWDIYGKHGKPAVLEHWSAADKARLADQLAGPDAKAAFQAVRRLVRQPAAAVALLREALKPAGPIDGKQLKRWLSDLDSADFAVRQTATAELERLGDRIEGQLQEALANKQSLEAKRRIEALLAKSAAPTPERLARWRALEALEQIATPDAVRLLDNLAMGAPGARLTREAAAARERLARAR